jgi:type 1 glutamine amidotransferase
MRLVHLLLAAILALAAWPATAKVVEHDRGAILIFSHTTGYRHESIPAGIAAIRAMAKARGLAVVASEDPAMFDPGQLKSFRAVVLLSPTTDPKRPESEWLVGARRTAFQQFVRRGGGVVAIHAAADSHYHWPWYGRLIGGRFQRHPPGTPTGRVTLANPGHPANRGLPATAVRTDEWYYFDDFDPTSTVLMSLDPASIGEADVNPNPVSWARTVDGGRVFYTALGHTGESYSEPFFLKHVADGLDWVLAARR